MNHSDESAPPASPPRSRRKWLWLGGFVLLLLCSIGGFWGYLHNAADKGWRAAVAEAEQDDPHWRWEDMQARRRTWKEAENGALVVRRAKALRPREWPAWDTPIGGAGPGRSDVPAGEDQGPGQVSREEEERLALQESFGRPEPQIQLTERQLTALREELKKAEEAVTEARRMADFPGGRFAIQYTGDFITTLMPELDDARSIANLLGYDVLLRAQEQDLSGALTSCQALLHLSRYLDEEPSTLAMLVRVAIRAVALRRLERVLAQGEPEPAELARLQKLLTEEEAVPMLLQALRGERAGTDMLAQRLETGQTSWGQLQAQTMGGGSPPGSALDSLLFLFPGSMRQQRAGLLQMNNRVIAIARAPRAQRQAEEDKLIQEIPTLPVFARLMAPALLKVSNASQRSLAELRCVLVMLAAERYRHTHQRWPESVADLVPAFLAQVPEDPFDGKPLRFQRVHDSLVIYSVSLDGTDDGGKLSNRQEKGTDLGFRLWDVKQRRQPPK